MASAPISQPGCQSSEVVRAFAAANHAKSCAARFGIDPAGLAALLTEVLRQRGIADTEARAVLESLHLEELVLARACIAGNDTAWEIFMTRYRATLYEAAYSIAHDEAAGRVLADSLYAELYGMNEGGEARPSKLRYYLGRGSLAGWLRTVIAQEYVNQYRRSRRTTSLEAAIDGGKQFAAAEAEAAHADPRINLAAAEELASLSPEERFLLAAYYLDRRTMADIAGALRVHESTVSRKLERITEGLRKRIRKRLLQSGMSPRQADEALEDVDVRDLEVKVRETLGQDHDGLPFYKRGV